MDLDADGKTDMVSGSYPGEIYFFKRKPNGTFAAAETLKNKDGKKINIGRAAAVSVADWNGDGLPDLIVGNINGAVFLIKNVGTKQKPLFDTAEKLKAGGGKAIVCNGDAGPCVADWDGDGRPDLLLGSDDGSVQCFRNVGSKDEPRLAVPVVLVPAEDERKEKAEESKPQEPKRSSSRSKPAVADWNGDGRPDLIVGDFLYRKSSKECHGSVWVYLRKPDSESAARK